MLDMVVEACIGFMSVLDTIAFKESVRATLPPSMLFADRALLRRGYSMSGPDALVETVRVLPLPNRSW